MEQDNDRVMSIEKLWTELEILRQKIDRSWQSEKTAVELVLEQRRKSI